jgi:murein L,D-transpeptidase YcbB/YkuD
MKAALAYYRQVAQAGGWPTLPPGEILRPDDRGDRVLALRARLSGPGGREAGYSSYPVSVFPWCWFPGPLPLVPASDDPALFDRDLAAAVRSFQARHGLQVDGLVGEKTLAALNEPAAQKAARIALNLERIRWLGEVPGPRFIKVNIPACRLDVISHGRTVLSMRAVVGRPDRPTPVISGQIRWLELNPYWNVPQKLARLDILPQVLKDPRYLEDRGFRVFQDWKRGAGEIDVDEVAWASLQSWDMDFRFCQDPGPLNPLGNMKFLFLNPFSVYLHGTNHPEVFRSESRFLSSGCIRLEAPGVLAEYLAPRADLAGILESGRTQTLGLADPATIFLVYQTVWIDGSGRVNFSPDIYGYDARMQNLMDDPLKETLAAK